MSYAAPKLPDFEYDPFTTEVMGNPHPYYKRLRDDFPVYYIEQYDGFAFSRFADVYEAYQHDDCFHTIEGVVVSREEISVPRLKVVPEWSQNPLPLFANVQAPAYEEIRQAAGKLLRPRPILNLEEDVRTRTKALLETLLEGGPFDFVLDFAGIVAAGSACNICGIPLELAPEVLKAVNYTTQQDPVTGGFSPDFRNRREVLKDIIKDVIRQRRKVQNRDSGSPVDGLIDYRLNGRALTDDEIATLVSSIVVGASETIPKVLAHGMMELERSPEQKRAILQDLRANAAVAVEEMVRFCGPAQWFMRTVKTPVTIAGQKLEVGHRVFLLVQSANRDEREFERADEFIWDRRPARHLGFGHGQHFCIGTHLARMEGRVMLQEVLSRVPEYSIVDAKRTPSSFQWGFHSAIFVAG